MARNTVWCLALLELSEHILQSFLITIALSKSIYIDGMQLVAFMFFGDLGTTCEIYKGWTENLDYKSTRYSGRAKLMNFFFHDLLMREDRQAAGKILTNAKPPVDDDVVYVHASAEGELDGRMSRKEFVRAYHPINVLGEMRTAIAWTTSASALAIIEMVNNGSLPSQGFLKQEEIPLDAFFKTNTGALYDHPE